MAFIDETAWRDNRNQDWTEGWHVAKAHMSESNPWVAAARTQPLRTGRTIQLTNRSSINWNQLWVTARCTRRKQIYEVGEHLIDA